MFQKERKQKLVKCCKILTVCREHGVCVCLCVCSHYIVGTVTDLLKAGTRNSRSCQRHYLLLELRLLVVLVQIGVEMRIMVKVHFTK